MPTVTEVTTAPSSGLVHIDALLDTGPGWNWLTPARNVIYYTFSLAHTDPSAGSIYSGAAGAYNSAQQAAVATALGYIGGLTGITFTLVANGAGADLHFVAADLIGASVAGLSSSGWSYSSSGGNVVAYSVDSWVYLDNVQWTGDNASPSPGTHGYETLLHELGHSLGLKHPFEGGTTLPPGFDSTAYTLMSYTHVGGPYSEFRPYDIAALMWLYGGDGLGGSLGHGSSGRWLMGTDAADTLSGGSGNDVFEAGAGNDRIEAGLGNDTARFDGLRAGYTITAISGGFTVSGADGSDTLIGVEFAAFDDQTVTLGGGGGGGGSNNPPTGTMAVVGSAVQGSTLATQSTLADADGLGSFSYRWQSSADGSSWADIGGATAASFTPAQAEVGRQLRVVVSWTDGQGHAETVNSASTAAVANTNDSPTGEVLVGGLAAEGATLTASHTLADADGLGTIAWTWQSSANGSSWADIAGASAAQFSVPSSLVGQFLRAVARWTDGYGQAESVASAPTSAVANVNQPPTGSLTLAGTPRQGEPLTAAHTLGDPDGLGTLQWKWQSSANGTSWTDIAGASAASFTPGQAQVGLRLRVVASWRDGQGSDESVASAASASVANVNDPPSGSLVVSGTPRQGSLLTAVSTLADPDGLGTLRWQWQSSTDGLQWVDIAGASARTFTPGQAQVGRLLRPLASWTDALGSAESVPGTPSTAVANVNDAPTGSVSLSGTVEQGRTLTASHTLADADGLGTIVWQWQSSPDGSRWTNIPGADAAQFSPGRDEVGQRLRVQASWTDGHGSAEAVASSASAAVSGRQVGTTGDDQLLGTAFADLLQGGDGNDRLQGAGGNDRLEGGDGRDAAVFQRARADYTVAKGATSVFTFLGDEGTDTLVSIERLHFADLSLAFDTAGDAGTTARILGAIFGRESVANAAYAGIGLALLAQGMSRDALMALALEARLGVGYTPAAEVELLYRNLLGVAPSADELAHWTAQLANGTYSAVSLAWMAAELPLVAEMVGLAGLADTGLPYTG